MVHEPESEFAKNVKQLLENEYGEDKVEGGVYLLETRRYVDFYVEAPLVDLAIEVENDFEAVFKGVGQSLVYSHGTEVAPVIVVPEGHIDEPELEILGSHVPIVQLSF